jgi:RNA polymerase sigma-70 factor (ECF subfamily)
VFKNIGKYNPSVSGLYTWIRSVTVHTAIDFIRRRDDLCLSYEPEQIPETAISNEIVEKTDAHELLRLIRLLPPATQTVFNLHIIDGFQHKEIAQMTGISEGTSKWHVNEARRMLKKWIRLQQSQV